MLGTITITVGQSESEDVRERDSDKEMAAQSAVVEDITKDRQEEMPEVIEQIPSESNLEELTQPTESQANDVGFKKVFKFVGFKFTVKKDKNEKSDTVQVLAAKKDEVEGTEGSNGAGDHQELSVEIRESASKESELKQSTEQPEDSLKLEPSNTEVSLQTESGQGSEEGKDEGEEKEPTKTSESPTSPVATETASPFKKFFTQGWAGWRKKTSFRKTREEELEALEKKKEQEPERSGAEEKTEETSEEQPQPQDPTGGVDEARLSGEFEKVELPSEDPGSGLQGSSEEKCAPLATEIFDDKIEVQQEVIAEVHVASATEKKTEEQESDVADAGGPSPPENLVEMEAGAAEELVETEDVCVPREDGPQPAEPSAEEQGVSRHPEGVVSEVEMLSSQERIKVQGSPLKKLFTSTGLKKRSGKKQKGKRAGDDESGEQPQAAAESPDSADEQKGESSPSSPEEPEEITCLEKGIAEGHQEGEAEEGATSDGEKKREGITPWASFKKMVTPKKRVRRPSESDKEDELDKVKSSTLSSTESAVSEMQEETKGTGEEQKPEEPKRKVDTSVSWEALICVGSSKKRARKGSSSDEEEGPKTTGGDGCKAEEAGKDKETGSNTILASSQDQDQGPGSFSPEPAGSPSEGEGVSTWESFKRLVTPRKKSKSKLEEKTEEPAVEHLASEVEPGKEESWVSIKKFIPGRRKKRSDGKQEQVAAEDQGPTEANEDDPDVPAVVPLSEYDAVEREKLEAQQALQSAETSQGKMPVDVPEELSKNLVHTVTVAVIDGTRAVTDIEERSPSWISASVTEPLEQAEEEDIPLIGEVTEREVIAEETPVVTETLPESREAQDVTMASEVELTSEAVTAAETTEALGAEEATEASGAEETTEMVSAVSQLTESPDTTEEATPVQEVEGDAPDMEDQERRTQAVLQAVAEKVKEESQLLETLGPEGVIQTSPKEEPRAPEVEGAEEGLRREMEVPGGETKAEHSTPGPVVTQTSPESSENIPHLPASAESKRPETTCQEETLAEVKSQENASEEAHPPDSTETLTDSGTNGSTPVADFEALDTMQQDEVAESQEEDAGVSGTQSQVTLAEAVPGQKEGPPSPPHFQSQEENIEQSEMEESLDHRDPEVSVEAVPILSKTEGIQETGQFAEEEAKDGEYVEELEAPSHTEKSISQEEVTEVALTGEVTMGAESQNDNTDLRSPSPEMAAQGEEEETEKKSAQVSEEIPEQKAAVPGSEEPSQELAETVSVPGLDGRQEEGSLEAVSPGPDPKGVGCTEVHVQSSEALASPAAVEEKVLEETIEISETGEILECAGARLGPEGRTSEKEDSIPQPGDTIVLEGPEPQAESMPAIVSATPERGLPSDLEGEKSTSQKQRSDEDEEQTDQQEGQMSVARDDPLGENEAWELETRSSKFVQNIIQTAVDQFTRSEETATGMLTTEWQTQTLLMQADSQEATEEPKKEEEESQESAQDEREAIAAQEEPELTAVHPPLADASQDVSAASEKIVTAEIKSPSVSNQQGEELILSSKAEGDGTGMKSVSDEGQAELGERTKKLPLESKEDEKGDADHPENQSSTLADADASGDLTKESLDANGPKPKEEEDAQEVGFHGGKVHSESEKEPKPQTEEQIQKHGRELARPELAES
ncbi:A-kinase anchoring protein 12 [Ictidomys tridecemlineatus]|uniref:A-kinase anchoring protein 12 n=1 Tax=Ictidomys tridecemlineatus TaxID=43179 RepID=I3MY19_ICTTR|nr:A-kinase anchor protein 12 [Ictidomys tridecemlineatus]KAG3290435.1 A-kinase anchoring protein 12 [Ictidomys tridecemlineatus]